MKNLIICLSLSVSASAGDGRSLEAFLHSGDSAYAAFRTLDAIEWYSTAAEVAPGNYEVLTRLTRAWCDMGRLTLRRSDSSEVYYRRSVEFAERLTQHHPDSATSWFLLALCHGSLAPFKSIAEKLNIARDVERNAIHSLKIDSSYAMTYVLLGIYYRAVSGMSWVERTVANSILGKDILGTLEESESRLRKAIQLEPQNSYAWFELAVTMRRMERPKEAEEALEKCVALPATNEREALQKRQALSMLERIRMPSSK